MTNRSSIVPREHEHSRSLEHSNVSNNTSEEKQSRSFDGVHLLRPVLNNRRTKSSETSDDCPTPIAPPPIVIKIPDMRQLVQAAKLCQYDNYPFHSSEQFDRTSPDLFTSTSIDSAGAMAIEQNFILKTNENDLLNYEHRRKSSSNLLLPPAEVRRQALRKTFEKRRRCIEQDNSSTSTKPSTDLSSLFNNFNSKSENSSFDRSLETDFDVQSDASSRGPTDQFTSIESSGNENVQPSRTNHLIIDSTHPHDSGFKSIESPNETFSFEWISADTEINPLQFDEQQINQQIIKKKLIPSTSFIRTASKRRRDFGKEKRFATSNTILPHSNIYDQQRFSSSISHPVFNTRSNFHSILFI